MKISMKVFHTETICKKYQSRKSCRIYKEWTIEMIELVKMVQVFVIDFNWTAAFVILYEWYAFI